MTYRELYEELDSAKGILDDGNIQPDLREYIDKLHEIIRCLTVDFPAISRMVHDVRRGGRNVYK